MKNRNICKFVSASVAHEIDIINFVYESSEEVMRTAYELSCTRMYLAVSAEGRFVIDGSPVSVRAGDVVFAFAQERVRIESSGGFECMYVSFCGRKSDELLLRFGINRACRRYEGFEGLIPLFKNTISRVAEDNIDLAAEGLLLYTLSLFDSSRAEGSALINRIIEITDEQFYDRTLSIGSVAAQVCYNAKYISHLFKEKMGIGYSEYLRDIRIKYAISLFEHGIDSVKNVALLSGFSDPLYFSAVFKKTVGVSPREYKLRSNEAGSSPEGGGA